MNNRKEEIIMATLKLAAENGLGTVSMQQIADKVGITKASLYNHFSSRDEIVKEMYEVIRKASREKTDAGKIDYDIISDKLSLRDFLKGTVGSYRKMVSDPHMYMFYKIIMSERSINSTAADIMVMETKTMINATKAIFYALQVKGIADFYDVDTAALSFAMGVHSIIDYEFDLKYAGKDVDNQMMSNYIDEFCRIYGKKKEEKGNEKKTD